MTIGMPDATAVDSILKRLMEGVTAEFPTDPTTLAPAEGRKLTELVNRRWNTDLPKMAGVSETLVKADASIGSSDCRIKILVPANAGTGAILFVHGGGFAFCSPETHERTARLLAAGTGAPVLLPDYRLAPEHGFPAGLKDIVACLRSVFDVTKEAGVKAGRLLLAGDSAGANLALAAMLHEVNERRALPVGALLFYGVYDADFETASYRHFADGPGLTRSKMQRYWDWYAAPVDRANSLAAPLKATDEALASLPPLHLMAAGIDPLLSDTLNLAKRLAELGRSERAQILPGMTHGFLQMTNALPQARQAVLAAATSARVMMQR
jgi:acetyl esterase